MKFLRLNNILILTGKGQESSSDTMTVTFTNLGNGADTAEFYYDPKNGGNLSWKATCTITNGSCNVGIATLLDGAGIATVRHYVVKLYEGSTLVASGRFGMEKNTSIASPLIYEFEIQEVWRAIAYLAELLSVDEENIDKLITGYITE